MRCPSIRDISQLNKIPPQSIRLHVSVTPTYANDGQRCYAYSDRRSHCRLRYRQRTRPVSTAPLVLNIRPFQYRFPKTFLEEDKCIMPTHLTSFYQREAGRHERAIMPVRCTIHMYVTSIRNVLLKSATRSATKQLAESVRK